MNDAQDMELVQEFARTHSDAAFAELVRRYVNLVYSVARRCTGNDDDARDVVQAVFIILARKAGGLRERTVLSGWLYETTRYTATRLLRANARRLAREQEAYMQSTLDSGDTAEAWEKVSPHLEAAMSGLGERDRALLVLRFYENKTGAEAAALLGMRANTAHRRVARAIEKLRKFFMKRGMTLSAALIASAVAANAVQAAPAGMAASVTATVAAGATIPAKLTMLVKGTMKTLTWIKLKLAVGVAAAVLLVGGAATVAVSEVSDAHQTAKDVARESQKAYAALTSYSDTTTGTSEGGGMTQQISGTTRLQRPNLCRVEWTSTGGLYTGKGIVWSDSSGNYQAMGAADKFDLVPTQKEHDMQMAFAGATGVSGGAASTIAGAFFKLKFGDKLGPVALSRLGATREADETIGGVPCYVLEYVIDASKFPEDSLASRKMTPQIKDMGTNTTRLWIGKNDHLIRKAQTVSEGAQITMKFSDAAVKSQLENQNQPVTPANMAAMREKLEKSQAAAQGVSFTFTETHDNIVVNQKFAATDFAR